MTKVIGKVVEQIAGVLDGANDQFVQEVIKEVQTHYRSLDPVDEFIASISDIRLTLFAIGNKVDDHFGWDPDNITEGNVVFIERIAKELNTILEDLEENT